MTDFFSLLLLYAYFRFFDFRLLAHERLFEYNLWRVLFTAHDSFRDPIINDPVSVAVHPSKALWAYLRPAIVFLPIWGVETFSPVWTARFAAIGLMLLVGPLAMPRPNPMRRTYSSTEKFQAWAVAAFNNLMVVVALGAIFYFIRKLTGFQVKADWLFINWHLVAGSTPQPHSEEIATGGWVIALVMIFVKSCVWSKMVITQGMDGFGYRPADMMPTKTDTARSNNFRSLA